MIFLIFFVKLAFVKNNNTKVAFNQSDHFVYKTIKYNLYAYSLLLFFTLTKLKIKRNFTHVKYLKIHAMEIEKCKILQQYYYNFIIAKQYYYLNYSRFILVL